MLVLSYKYFILDSFNFEVKIDSHADVQNTMKMFNIGLFILLYYIYS